MEWRWQARKIQRRRGNFKRKLEARRWLDHDKRPNIIETTELGTERNSKLMPAVLTRRGQGFGRQGDCQCLRTQVRQIDCADQFIIESYEQGASIGILLGSDQPDIGSR